MKCAPDVATLTFTGKESVKLHARSAASTLTFDSMNEEQSGMRVLTFSYRGKLETQPHGLFGQHYATATGEQALPLSTEKESMDARRMFRCWDEPAFRATFTLIVTVPAQWATVSDMPVAERIEQATLATTTFARSPRMPSDLIESLAAISRHSAGVPLRTTTSVARDEKDAGAQQHEYRALMNVGDAALAQQATQIALSSEIAPPSEHIRRRLIEQLRVQRPALA